MKNLKKIFFILFIFSGINLAQNYLTIESGNSLFIPNGCQLCSNNIVVEEGAHYITEDPSGTCSDAVVTGNGVITFPVELISFTGNVDGKQNILLKWETATEINNFGFDVERSYRDTLLFEKIGFVPGQGNSNSENFYSFTDKLQSTPNSLYYRLIQINTDGSFSVSATIKVEIPSPKEYFLSQNYPNPFNPSTKIAYEIPFQEVVKLRVYDILGNMVTTLINQEKPAGSYEVEFNTSSLSSGIYFYTLQAGNFMETRKMVFLK